jgi:hypothetical protein
MNRILVLLCPLFLGLVACGGDTANSASSSSRANSSANSALVAKFKSLPSLITVDQVRDTLGLGPIEIEYSDRSNIFDDPRNIGMTFSWAGDRVLITDLGFTKIETPKSNRIELDNFRVVESWTDRADSGLEYLERNVRSVSAEEMAQAQANMANALAARVERGEMTAEQARIAGGMGSTLAANPIIVEIFEDIADQARWNVRDRTLWVAHKNVIFSVQADISDDNETNRDAAVAIARKFLSNAL